MRNLLKCIGLVFKHGGFPALLLSITVITNGALAPLNIWIWQNIIDSVTENIGTGSLAHTGGEGGIMAVLPWVAAFIFVLLLYNLRELIEQVLMIRITHRLRDNLLPVIADKILNLEYRCFEERETHDLIGRVGNSPESQFTRVFWGILFIPSYAVAISGYALLFINAGWWVLPLVALLSLPALILSIRHGTESYFLSREQSMESRMAGYISSLLTSRDAVKEIRIFGLNQYLGNKWKSLSRQLVAERLSLNITQQKRSLYIDAASILLIFGSIGGFALSARSGNMTFGEFVALSGSMTGIVSMVTWYIPYQVSQLRSQSMYWEDYQEFINLPEARHDADMVSKKSIGCGIDFHEVDFTYPNTDRKVLRGVSFHLDKGEKIAIVGRNGAGKSTIIKLLLGLYKPDSGRITVDGMDLSEIDPQSRRDIFSVVFQDFFKYSLSVRENIGLGRVERMKDDDAILSAAEKGMADEIIRNLSDGLETRLGKVYEEGSDLSVGEWQRIAMSRAAMAESQVIILDEPASALDPVAEADLYRGFAKMASDKAVILISHRLGSARMADRILVIEEGRVAEEGTHEELMKKKGIYHDMFEAQADWYREEETA